MRQGAMLGLCVVVLATLVTALPVGGQVERAVPQGAHEVHVAGSLWIDVGQQPL